jgi:hypothetical protein
MIATGLRKRRLKPHATCWGDGPRPRRLCQYEVVVDLRKGDRPWKSSRHRRRPRRTDRHRSERPRAFHRRDGAGGQAFSRRTRRATRSMSARSATWFASSICMSWRGLSAIPRGPVRSGDRARCSLMTCRMRPRRRGRAGAERQRQLRLGREPLQKLSVAAPVLIRSWTTLAPLITTPSRRSS